MATECSNSQVANNTKACSRKTKFTAKESSDLRQPPSELSGHTINLLKFYEILFLMDLRDEPKDKLLKSLIKKAAILTELTPQMRNQIKRGYYSALM